MDFHELRCRFLDQWHRLWAAWGVGRADISPMTTKHPHHKPAVSHKKPAPPVHIIDDEPVEEPLPEKVLPPEPVKPAIALPPPSPTPLSEAEDILRTLADSSASRLGTVHGVDLINAAKKWLATHGRH